MKIEENVPLKDYTTFRLGGPARYFSTCVDEQEVEEAVAFAKEKNVPIFILGGGSNTVFTDKGFSGVVIQIAIKGMSLIQGLNDEEALVVVNAGEDWDEFVLWSMNENLHGLENLSYIPGTVGGAPVQNIGAYGVEVGTFVEEVKAFDMEEGKKKIFKNADCNFSYRNSIFKNQNRYIILSVTFRLRKKFEPVLSYNDVAKEFENTSATSESLREAIIRIRQRKLPDWKVLPTAGSFFKNPEVSKEVGDSLKEKFPDIVLYPYGEGYKVSAGYLIDKVAGMKGKKIGGIAVYEKHALVLVNEGNGTYQELEQMIKEIKEKVKEGTGVELEAEVNII